MSRWFLFTIAAVPLLFIFGNPPDTPALVWWTTHAMDKVRPYDREPAEPIRSVRIHAARNEFEPFQVVFRAEDHDTDGVDIEVTDLRGPNGALISKNYISVYLEKYIDLKVPSSVDGDRGEWPDALVPRIDNYAHEKRNAFPFKLIKGRNQPVWVDVYVPRSAAPGKYEGQVRVLISGKPEFRVPVELDVWPFELPSTSSLITTFGFSGIAAVRKHYGKYTNDHQLYELSSVYQKSALWHRISIHGGSGTPPRVATNDGQMQLDWKNFDDEAGPFMDGLAFAPTDPLYGAKATSLGLYTPPILKGAEQQIQYWQQVAEHLREKGWIDRAFNYLWDEPQPAHYSAMIRMGEIIHKADPDLKTLVTAPLHREWMGFIDIWAPVINCFEARPPHDSYCEMTVNRSAYDSELAKGKKLWWYQACGSHGCNIVGGDYFRGWPSYMIDHDGVRNRIMEWLSWKYDIKGELYFSMDEAFGGKKNPWEDVYLFGGNGDGTLFYPGTPEIIGGRTHIPVESIRLKLIREGLEDYEYLVMLANLAGPKTVSDLVNGFVRSTYDFDHDPHKLYSIREQMGRELDRLSK